MMGAMKPCAARWSLLATALAIGCASAPPPAPAPRSGAATPPPPPSAAPSARPTPPAPPPPPAPPIPAGAPVTPSRAIPPGARPSAGCVLHTITMGTQQRRVTVDGVARSFSVVVPPGNEPGFPLPLVFAFHGLGGSGNLARIYFGVEQQTENRAVFIYPDGKPQNSFNNRTGWDLRADGSDLRFFDAMLREVGAVVCFDQARVFAVGHSFGGYFTNALACQRAAALRGIATVAAGLPPGPCPGPAVAAWSTHGAADRVVPLAQGTAARDHWRSGASCGTATKAAIPAPCLAFDGCGARTPVQFCQHPGNHDWPSFAAGAIWRFFASLD